MLSSVWPKDLPVFIRVSSTDWVSETETGLRQSWTVEQTIKLTELVIERGVDLVDATVAAVGRIADPQWAQQLLTEDQADAVFIGRPLLANPSWVNQAAQSLGEKPRYLEQYGYAL